MDGLLRASERELKQKKKREKKKQKNQSSGVQTCILITPPSRLFVCEGRDSRRTQLAAKNSCRRGAAARGNKKGRAAEPSGEGREEVG